MKKNAIVLLGDYWHPAETIEPLLPMIFDEKEWNVKVTDDPNYIALESRESEFDYTLQVENTTPKAMT